MINSKITIRPEEYKDYKSIVALILRSFCEGTDYLSQRLPTVIECPLERRHTFG